MYSIGELSRATGVKVPTIRYYEGVGLIEADERTEGNQRRYSRAGLERLGFIRHARDLGLSLDAIRALVALDPANHCRDSRHCRDPPVGHPRPDRAAQAAGAELLRIVEACDGGPGHDCNILEAFGDHRQCDHEH